MDHMQVHKDRFSRKNLEENTFNTKADQGNIIEFSAARNTL